MILLDTDTVVAHLRGNAAVTNKIFEKLTDIGLPAIVLAELEYGARISARPEKNLEFLHDFTDTIVIVPFDALSAHIYGNIKARLKSSGITIGEVDVFIAAITIARDAILVTHNVKHFELMQGLKSEDWF